MQVGSGEIPAIVDDEWEDIDVTVEHGDRSDSVSVQSSLQPARKRGPSYNVCFIYVYNNSKAI